MIPDSLGRAATGPARFDIRARVDPSPSLPLGGGIHDADFEFREMAATGPATSYGGRARLWLRIVDDTHPGFPIVHVEAIGEGDGIRFELAARCRALVAAGGRSSTPRTDDHPHPART